MKQVGITLLVMAVLGMIGMSFQLDDTIWETLFRLLVMGTAAFIPQFKQILAWKLHWRLALGVGVICTFILVWQLLDRFMGAYQAYSLPATMILFGMLAFLFHYLDTRDSKVGP
jgi:hypothetical protein